MRLSLLLVCGAAIAAPQTLRVTKADCAKAQIEVVYPQSCERRLVQIAPAACKTLAVGDRVHLGAYDKTGKVRAAKRLGPTQAMTGRIILLDQQGGYVQIVDGCGFNCNAKLPRPEAKALEIEEGVELTGVFDWSKTCDVKGAHGRKVTLPPPP